MYPKIELLTLPTFSAYVYSGIGRFVIADLLIEIIDA